MKKAWSEVLVDGAAATQGEGEGANAAQGGVEDFFAVGEDADLRSPPRVLVDGRDGALVDAVGRARSERRLGNSQ